MTSAIIYNDISISLLVTNNYYDDHYHRMMYFCAIIKIDCECSALLITVDNVNTFWTCVYCIFHITMAEICKYGSQIINVVSLRYIKLKCAIIML